MTMHAATERLWQAAHQLRDDVFTLRLQAVEDRPCDEPNKLVEDVGAVSESLAGWAEAVADAAARTVAGTDDPAGPPDMRRIRRTLGACSDAVERLGAELHEQLAATTRLDELNALARRSGPELRAWVGAIKHALDRVHQSLLMVQAALTTCWRELAEQPAPSPAPELTDTARS